MDKLFTGTGKKIVIGSSLQESDIIIKDQVKRRKTPAVNIEKETVISLATGIINGNRDFSGFTLLDNDEAKALFYTFLKDNLSSGKIFGIIPEESFSFNTSSNAYDTLSMIRSGAVTDKTSRIVEIADKFDSYLYLHNYLDEIMIIRKAVGLLDSDSESALSSIGYGKKPELLCLPSLKGHLTYLESSFLDKLAKAYGTTLKYCSYEHNEDHTERIKVPAYGYSNVVRYIVSEIVNNHYNLNDVAVLTSNDAYDGLIRTYFENHDIPYSFENGESIMNEDFTGFINSVLDFLKNHFATEYLYALYKNPALGYYEDKDGNRHNYANFRKLKDLKADKDQIIAQSSLWPQEKKNFVTDLVNLYGETDTVSGIFDKVFDFTLKYTTDYSHRYCKDAFFQKKRLFMNADSIGNSYQEKTDFIKSVISSVKISKDNLDKTKSYVTVSSFRSTYLPRKYNFFIGLSADEAIINDTESPFAGDEAIRNIIDCDSYFVDLPGLKNERLQKEFAELISSQSEGKQYLIASEYDSVEFKQLSKSALYLSASGREVPLYYGQNIIDDHNTDPIDYFLYPQTVDNINKVNDTDLSPSRVETMLECPLKYMYGRIYDEVELDEHDNRWLKGGDEGTFAHEMLKSYFEQVTGTSFDKALFDNCFDTEYQHYKLVSPFSDSNIQDIEAEKVKNMTFRYLQRYYALPDAYKPLYCELDLKEADSVTCSLNPAFSIHGIIDRVDAYVGENGELKIRIIDYKTYNSTSYKEHKDGDLWVQRVLYPELINQYVNNHYDEVVAKVGRTFTRQAQYDITFIYEILKMDKQITPDYSEVSSMVKDTLNKFALLKANPTWNNFLAVYDPEIITGGEHKDGKCRYCRFARYCRMKMQKGDSYIWNK